MNSGDPRQRLAYDRTHLANERTFAAWIRTGLSVAAIGFAVVHFVHPTGPERVTALVLGTLFVLAGAGMIGLGALRFLQVRRDLATATTRATRIRPGAIVFLTMVLVVLLVVVLILL